MPGFWSRQCIFHSRYFKQWVSKYLWSFHQHEGEQVSQVKLVEHTWWSGSHRQIITMASWVNAIHVHMHCAWVIHHHNRAKNCNFFSWLKFRWGKQWWPAMMILQSQHVWWSALWCLSTKCVSVAATVWTGCAASLKHGTGNRCKMCTHEDGVSGVYLLALSYSRILELVSLS